MAAGNCVSPHMAAGNGLQSRSDWSLSGKLLRRSRAQCDYFQIARLYSNALQGQISERDATPLASAEVLHAWIIFKHAEITQAGAKEKTA